MFKVAEISSDSKKAFIREDAMFLLDSVRNSDIDVMLIMKTMHPHIHKSFIDSIFEDERICAAWIQAVHNEDHDFQKSLLIIFFESLLKKLS